MAVAAVVVLQAAVAGGSDLRWLVLVAVESRIVETDCGMGIS